MIPTLALAVLSTLLLSTLASAPCGPDSPDIVYNSVPPGYAPPHSHLPVCPFKIMDFNEFSTGDYIHDQYKATHGVTITAIKTGSNGYTPLNGKHNDSGGAARIFDTSKPRGRNGNKLCGWNDGDKDLGSPNEFCPGGGPGIGIGGALYLDNTKSKGFNPYANCESQGKVLIIQEKNKSCPDDSSSGGRIIFDFDRPVRLVLAKLLDVDEDVDKIPEVTATFADDTSYMKMAQMTGENGLVDVVMKQDNVVQAEIYFKGSGSISQIVYQELCPANSS